MHSPNGLRAILFDLDGTLRHSQPSGDDFLHQLLAELDQPVAAAAWRQGVRRVHAYWASSGELLVDLARLYPTPQADRAAFDTNYLRKRLRWAGLHGELDGLVEVLHRRMEAEHQPVDYVPEQAPPMLAALRQAGYVLGLVSNRRDPLGPLAQALGLGEAFDFTLAAGEIGVYKPAPGIFQHAAALAGAPVHQTVYVGDNYYADILGAAAAGVPAILVDPHGLFPEATCPVIQHVWHLPDALPQLPSPPLPSS